MIFQLTDFAVDLLQKNPTPTLTSYSLMDEVGRVATPDPSGLVGEVVFRGTPSIPEITSASTLRYSIVLDKDAGPFSFGGVALYVGTDLFAYGYASSLFDKLTGDQANTFRLDVYLTSLGKNYNMWMNYAESSNAFNLTRISSVNALPTPRDAVPNAYVVPGYYSRLGSFLAYTDKQGLWNFDAYKFQAGYDNALPVVSGTSKSVIIKQSENLPNLSPRFTGQIILQFTTGELYGVCRYVTTARYIDGNIEIGFDAPLFILPKEGDTFIVSFRSTDTVLDVPVASENTLGIVKIGKGISINAEGVISVNLPEVTGVMTINGEKPDADGNIDISTGYTLPEATATELGGVKLGNDFSLENGELRYEVSVVKTVNNEKPDEDGNVNTKPYELPIASDSTLGGVKVGKTIQVSEDGILDVKIQQHISFSVSVPPLAGMDTILYVQRLPLNLVFTEANHTYVGVLDKNATLEVLLNNTVIGHIEITQTGIQDTSVFPSIKEGDVLTIRSITGYEVNLNLNYTFIKEEANEADTNNKG